MSRCPVENAMPPVNVSVQDALAEARTTFAWGFAARLAVLSRSSTSSCASSVAATWEAKFASPCAAWRASCSAMARIARAAPVATAMRTAMNTAM